MKIKMSFLKHLKVLWLSIFTTILYLLGWWYFDFKKDVFFIFLVGYVLTVVPSFFLHINYYIKNRKLICEILPGAIIIEKAGERNVIEKKDIRELVVFKSASIDKGGIPITPMEVYFFVRVVDCNGNKYDLTCLMDTKIDKSIKIVRGVNIRREKGLLNFA